jgi:pimeloyl-ACP methyl ester carboxylesterase
MLASSRDAEAASASGSGSWVASALLTAASIGGALFVGLAALLYTCQNRLMYLPEMPLGAARKAPKCNPAGCRSPEEVGLKDFENVYMTTADGVRIHGWFIRALSAPSSSTPTCLFFHGNAGNVGFRLANVHAMVRMVGCHVFIIDYRGFGNSEGSPTEEGLVLDAIAALEALQGMGGVDATKVFLFGRSLGGAVALALAVSRPQLVRALIVENTFLSISDMVDTIFPFFRYLKWLVLRIRWANDELAPQVTCPVLLISGLKDELVPPWHMSRLRDLFKIAPSVRFYAVPDGSHNETWHLGGMGYYEEMVKFLSEALA